MDVVRTRSPLTNTAIRRSQFCMFTFLRVATLRLIPAMMLPSSTAPFRFTPSRFARLPAGSWRVKMTHKCINWRDGVKPQSLPLSSWLPRGWHKPFSLPASEPRPAESVRIMFVAIFFRSFNLTMGEVSSLQEAPGEVGSRKLGTP